MNLNKVNKMLILILVFDVKPQLLIEKINNFMEYIQNENSDRNDEPWIPLYKAIQNSM